MNPDLKYWLAVLFAPDIGWHTLMQWLALFPNIKNIFHASDHELLAAGMNKNHIRSIKNVDWHAIETELKWIDVNAKQHIISFDDSAYPELLKKIYSPPPILYIKGNVGNLSNKQLAIVGSRSASPIGIQNAHQFAYCLAEAGLTITSGLALGIDGASHKGTLAAKGKTIGVAGTGLQHTYPPSHKKLVQDIIANDGTIISEFPLTMPPRAPNFPRRNRIIAGLTIGVLVIEAALKSGSLITARLALEEGREVFAIPGSIHHPRSRGCHYLIQQGGKLVESAQDIFKELQGFQALFTPVVQQPLKAGLPPRSTHILEKIGYEMTSTDEIIVQSGLTAGEVSSILLTLELHGYIQPVMGGYVRVVNMVGHQ